MMATSRVSVSVLRRAFNSSILHTARPYRAIPISRQITIPAPKLSQLRFYSQKPTPSKLYAFEDHNAQVQQLLEKPDPDRILIDTREPGELQATGTIPGALNIPVTTQPDAFFITAEEFEDRFGFDRPAQDQEVVFYCKAGVRSRAAAELARQAGWAKVGEYQGSWLDWEKKGGAKVGGRGA